MTFSPSLYRTLRGNNPPTSEEVAAVRTTLAGSLSRLQALENQAAQLQGRLDRLSLEKRELHDFVNGHRKFLSPARRLIPEILQEVFSHCLPIAHNAVMSVEEAPLLLGRVCSQWRQVAYSTPKLWTSIHIIVNPFFIPELCATREQAISAWISRSGVLPLSISMSTSGEPSLHGCVPRVRPNYHQVQPYLDLVTPHTQRWKSVHLSLPDFNWTRFLTQFKAADFPLLESVHIEGISQARSWYRSNRHESAALPKDNSILQAPQLRVLSMAGYMPWLLDIRVQWKQITALNLGRRSFYVDEVMKVLTMCPNLEVCSISLSTSGNQSPLIMPSPPSPPAQIAELCLPKLQTLSIFNCSSWNDHVIVLFEHLSAPVLRHLSYHRTVHVWPDSPVTREADNAFMAVLCAFLQRLVPPLEELEFYTRPFIGDDVLKVLPLVPGLKRLSLRGYSTDSRYHLDSPSLIIRMDDEFLEYLIPDANNDVSGRISPLVLSDVSDDENDGDNHDDSPVDDNISPTGCLCPNLEILHCTDAEFSTQRILEFLRARSTDHNKYDVAHLRRVGISFAIPTLTQNKVYPFAPSDANVAMNEELKDQIDELAAETGLMVGLFDPSSESFVPPLPLLNKYSPYAGLRATDTAPIMVTGSMGYFGFKQT